MRVGSGVSGNTIGGIATEAANVISGNNGNGVEVLGFSNRVQGNVVGLRATGVLALGNSGSGVRLEPGAHDNAIGGTDPGAGNIISANGANGVEINSGPLSLANNKVQGNFIGTNAAGITAFGNALAGIRISDAPNNLIGGATAGAGNVISGNGTNGVEILGSGLNLASGNQVQGNSIGTDSTGTASLGNFQNGVYITEAGNTVGGTGSAPRNVGSLNTSKVSGVDPDLRVRPFFHHGGTISIREFVVGALNAEMGLQAVDPDLTAASGGARITTRAGLVLDGSLDAVEAPRATSETDDPDDDGKVNEVPASLVDHLEFYLLNYFKAGIYAQTESTREGRELFEQIGCAQCHIPDLLINRDRRVADVETVYDPVRGIFNNLFATATPLFTAIDDGSGFPTRKRPRFQPFLVRNIFADFKRRDLGPTFYERNYDGTTRTQFMTTPLWGVGSTSPYGHDGRSINLIEVILRHGGEAEAARNRFARLERDERASLLDFLNSLIIFPPDDTASNLDPGNRNAAGFPQFGHGSVKLTVLFNNPIDAE